MVSGRHQKKIFLALAFLYLVQNILLMSLVPGEKEGCDIVYFERKVKIRKSFKCIKVSLYDLCVS